MQDAHGAPKFFEYVLVRNAHPTSAGGQKIIYRQNRRLMIL
jgi:hypothetical protein